MGRFEEVEKMARTQIPETSDADLKSRWQMLLLQVFVNQEKYDQAVEMAEAQAKEASDPELTQLWSSILHQIRLLSGKASQEDFEFYLNDLKQRSGNPQAVIQFAAMMYSLYQSGGEIGPLGQAAIAALGKEVEGAQDDRLKVGMYELTARLYTVNDEYEKALEAQQKGFEIAKDLSRDVSKRASLFLDELKSKAASSEDTESDK